MIARLIVKNVLGRPLRSVLTWLLLSLGVGAILILLTVQREAEQQLTRQIDGIDMVIGAKGSPLQIILSAVYHADAPTGNIDYAEAMKWSNHPMISYAVPLAYGDSYKSFRIVGTDSSFFDHYRTALAAGNYFTQPYEAVIGAAVAKQTGLQPGDRFFSTHGHREEGHRHDKQAFTVTGILAANGTVADKLVVCAISSVWGLHEDEQHDHDHEEKEEITAVLVKFRSSMALVQLPRIINESTSLQAAVPAIELNRLFTLLGIGADLFLVVGLVLLALAPLSMITALLQSLHEKKYELALLRSMGASRWVLVRVVMGEALLLAVGGFAGGWLFSRGCLWALQLAVSGSYAIQLSSLGWWPQDTLIGCGALVIALLAAAAPAIRAMQLNISKTLANG